MNMDQSEFGTMLRPLIAVIGRLLIASIFVVSGYNKIAAPTATLGYITAAHLPFPFLAFMTAVAIEIGGSLLLVFGSQTRIVALVMAVFCVATAFGFHDNLADPNQMVHFLKNISMAGGLLQLVAFGAGDLSVDSRLAGARRSAPTAA
jgi:putative oxidoreductase